MRNPQRRSLFFPANPCVFRHTGPFPVFRPPHQSPPHGIQMDILPFAWYSFTVRRALSKNRPCQSSPDSFRRTLIPIIALTLTDFITVEMVWG